MAARARKLLLTIACAAALAWPVAAEGLQERFNAAQAAFEAKDWAAAAEGFGSLVGDLSEAQRKGAVGAAILGRRGEALMHLGNTGAALGDLEEADRIFASMSETASHEAAANILVLARTYEMRGSLPAAAAAYARAGSVIPGGALSQARIGEGRSSIFHAPDRARLLIDAAIAEARSRDDTEANDELLTGLLTLRGRLALNQGELAAADEFYDAALAIAGRTARKIDINDARLRAEASYPDFLLGRRADALDILARSGAGRMMDETPPIPSNLNLPKCAPLGTVDRDDMMILDLSISDDGTVRHVTPVYSSRPGQIEAEFIEAMRETAWNSSDLEHVSLFFRASMRVQVRCREKDERQMLTIARHAYDLIAPKFGDLPHFGETENGGSTDISSRSADLRGRLADLDAGGDIVGLDAVYVLMALAVGETEIKDARVYRARADQTAAQLGWSPSERALLWAGPNSFTEATKRREYLDRIREVGADAHPLRAEALALLHIRAGREREFEDDEKAASAHYSSALATGLPRDSLPAQLANLRLASLSAAMRRFDDADTYLASSGLSPEQCSLVDLNPLVKNQGILPRHYPDELIMLQMSGQAETEFDVSAAGDAIAPRVIYSFPPFVFNETVLSGAKRLRFAPIYRQGAEIGCQDWNQRYKFQASP